MLKQISKLALIALFVVGSADAYASRARQLVLGTADPMGVLSNAGHGSLLIDDHYNMFYNPSYANDHKNWATVERANGSGNGEGGFVTGFGNLTLGVFMNRVDELPGFLNTDGLTTTSFVNAANMKPIDLIVAGDMGFKWGAGLTYAKHSQNANLGGSYLSVNAGAQMSGFEPFARFLIAGEEDTSATTANAFSNLTAGVRYRWGEWTPFAVYRSGDVTLNNATVSEDTYFGAGLVRNTRVGRDASLNYGVGYWRESTNDRTTLPINLSLESELTNWLIGRAGIAYNLIDQTQNATNPSAFGGRLGATLRFGQVDVDWAVGGGPIVAIGADPAQYGELDSSAFDLSNGFFSVASMTYRW